MFGLSVFSEASERGSSLRMKRVLRPHGWGKHEQSTAVIAVGLWSTASSPRVWSREQSQSFLSLSVIHPGLCAHVAPTSVWNLSCRWHRGPGACIPEMRSRIPLCYQESVIKGSWKPLFFLSPLPTYAFESFSQFEGEREKTVLVASKFTGFPLVLGRTPDPSRSFDF